MLSCWVDRELQADPERTRQPRAPSVRKPETDQRKRKGEEVSVGKAIDPQDGIPSPRSPCANPRHAEAGDHRRDDEIHHAPRGANEVSPKYEQAHATKNRAEHHVADARHPRIRPPLEWFREGLKTKLKQHLSKELQDKLEKDLNNGFDHCA